MDPVARLSSHALQALAPSFGVALLPVTRNSLWLPLLGIPFERAVAWHKAAARAALVLLVAHASLIITDPSFGVWILRNADAEKSGLVGDGAVYGTAAATLFAAQALLAMPQVRAYSWELFKISHMLFFPGALLCAGSCAPSDSRPAHALCTAALVLTVVHARMMLPYIVIPLFLWAADVAIRWLRAARRFSATLTPMPGGATRVEIITGGAIGCAVGQHVLLCVPELSSVQWHPLTLACAPGRPAALTLLAKAKAAGSWTNQLEQLAVRQAGSPVSVRFDGPYGRPSITFPGGYAAVVLVAGGVGITPMASFAELLLAQQEPPAITLVWVVRERAALTDWFPGLLKRLRASGRARLRLHVTAPKNADASELLAQDGNEQQAAERLSMDLQGAVAGGKTSVQGRASFDLEGGPSGGVERRHSRPSLDLSHRTSLQAISAAPEDILDGRPDIAAEVSTAVAAAAASGAGPSRVAVLVCGSGQLVSAAVAAAGAAGCHYHTESFSGV